MSVAPLVAPGRIDVQPGDMTFSASARGITLSALDAELARHNRALPVDGPDDAQLADLVSLDSSGPLRLGFGGWRDMLLGAQFEDGRGRLITVGGRVMKNVAGYDLTKFMVGSREVFGRLVTLSARCHLRPAAAAAARLAPDFPFLTLSPRPQWIVLTRSGLWAGYLGDAALIDLAVERVSALGNVQLLRHEPADDAAMRRRLWAPPDGDGTALRISLPPSRIGAFVVETRLLAHVADPFTGELLARVDPARVGAVRAAARAAGGRADAPQLPIQVSPPEAAVLRKLKASLDPDNTLSPLDLEVVDA